ncbi:hypothetical protein AJ79_03503 [Helicocarpus griseus UAMH5409]|uniref:Invertebrate defensins family profile domain-containing protein n=1 Tax=Helicocarpus griseus UAMH5409 TaxID=1447875 RepID=A0A2B7XXI7_9EURO|nr:hypothetical protein AJ79_03503 [Helicocarpus griseus UAMH5409]
MKLSAIIVSLFAAVAIAAPAREGNKKAALEKRQYCGQCVNGQRICCTGGAIGTCYGTDC